MNTTTTSNNIFTNGTGTPAAALPCLPLVLPVLPPLGRVVPSPPPGVRLLR